MARVAYWDIENEIAAIISAGMPDAVVTVENEMMFSAEQTPWIGVYLDRRDPTPQQPMAAGTVMRLRLRFSIWAWCYGLERAASFVARDDAIARLEEILMKNRTLNNKVGMCILMGGAMPGAKVTQYNPLVTMGANFLAGGEVILIAEVMATI